MNKIESVCVYCGSGVGAEPEYLATAKTLGRDLANAGIRLVYGGGSKGLMGAVADATLEHGGLVTGIIPQFLQDREHGHTGLTELIVTKDMHERKWAMFEKSDAFVALPGGIGTLEELIEILTWAQLGRHSKPVIVANINEYWNHLSQLLEHMSEQDFIHSHSQLNPVFTATAGEILPTVLTVSQARSVN